MTLIPRKMLVVSCQARADHPLHGPTHMAAMARAAAGGGASAIRADGPADVTAIKAAVDLPVIGILQRWEDGYPVYITPNLASARAVSEAGAAIIAVDAPRSAERRVGEEGVSKCRTRG